MKREEYIRQIIKIFWVFIIGSVIGYTIEMIVGFVQNGHFVSRQGLLFGPFAQVYGLGILFMKYIMPLINKIDKITKDTYFRTITALFAIFMTFNIIVSSMAGIRQNERNHEIIATNNIDAFFDKYYSDEVMDVIYENKKDVR